MNVTVRAETPEDLGDTHGEDLAKLHPRLGPVSVARDRNQNHHKSRVVKTWLAKHAGVVAEDFPG
jgi:hypothetical protein